MCKLREMEEAGTGSQGTGKSLLGGKKRIKERAFWDENGQGKATAVWERTVC